MSSNGTHVILVDYQHYSGGGSDIRLKTLTVTIGMRPGHGLLGIKSRHEVGERVMTKKGRRTNARTRSRLKTNSFRCRRVESFVDRWIFCIDFPWPCCLEKMFEQRCSGQCCSGTYKIMKNYSVDGIHFLGNGIIGNILCRGSINGLS